MFHRIYQGNVYTIVPTLPDNSIDCLITCYDENTDILTYNGWKPISSICYDDKIATLNPSSNYLEYQLPSKIIKSPYSGQMLYISTPYMCANVTPNHRFYIRIVGDKTFKLVRANELPDKFEIQSNCLYESEETKTVHISYIPKYIYPGCPLCNKTEYVRKWGKYEIEGEKWTHFRCYACNKSFYYQKTFDRHSKRMLHKDIDFNADDFLEFLGYWITEGSVDKSNTIILTQKDDEVFKKMVNVCKRLSLSYNIYNSRNNGVYDIKIYCPTLGFYLQKIGKTKDKHIPKEYMNLSKRQLKILYKALMCGDGDKVNHRRFWTTSEKLANQFQEILLKIGYSGNITVRNREERHRLQGYTIGINRIKVTPFVGNSGWNKGKNVREWINYNGYVYCISVPNQIVYVRREGKPMWCGNSPPYYKLRSYNIPPTLIGGDPSCEHEWLESNSDADLRHRGKNSYVGKDADEKTTGETKEVKGRVCKHCNAFFGQLGHEKTPREFVSHLVLLFNLIRPKLKDTATMFINISDTYSQSGGSGSPYSSTIHTQFSKSEDVGAYQVPHKVKGYPIKTRLCIPERFCTAMVDNGWILRNALVWFKVNATPESTLDRFSRKYEMIYFFTKSPDYYFNIDAVRRAITSETIERYKRAVALGGYSKNGKYSNGEMGRPTQPPDWVFELCADNNKHKQVTLFNSEDPPLVNTESKYQEVPNPEMYGSPRGHEKSTDTNILGGAPWDCLLESPSDFIIINNKGLKEKHYAAYGTELVEYLLKAGCPELICSKCGAPKRQVSVSGGNNAFNIRVRDVKEGRIKHIDRVASEEEVENYNEEEYVSEEKEHIISPGCSCGVEYVPAVVFDPFLGSGSTSLVAKTTGLSTIGCELSDEYIKIAIERCLFNMFDDFEVIKC